MIKVRTFTQNLEIMKTIGELNKLDDVVNNFLKTEKVKKVLSVSDAVTTNNEGMTMGIIRVLTYEL
ncbi:MAG: hypothetical protein AUJ74_06520 [Candidatus Omnitrophica bacterium CG1_02_44_16]|nr:MAG: hypothetical protein AUJ74_06520 [Candidatus Omnitrophica bacterium CG1_02_44_16]PIY83770.1 MAG: hypothetical protein COY78_00980 [Candidatus Omnitrophica bacterium CG_4_10_14_0_8_um_filter_44_12]PIZ84478.1 MAG: hypothetical protein COX96_03645 [Candidatus Omnitrophica bacterium CG_4_10_14_0_2_um_filter_44_9]